MECVREFEKRAFLDTSPCSDAHVYISLSQSQSFDLLPPVICQSIDYECYSRHPAALEMIKIKGTYTICYITQTITVSYCVS